MKNLIAQILKFGVVGVIATVIDFGVMIALVEILRMSPVIASGISFVVSLVFNYVASMAFVFTRRDDISRAREFAIFVVLSVIGLALNELIMWSGQAAFAAAAIRLVALLTAIVLIAGRSCMETYRKKQADKAAASSSGRMIGGIPCLRLRNLLTKYRLGIQSPPYGSLYVKNGSAYARSSSSTASSTPALPDS